MKKLYFTTTIVIMAVLAAAAAALALVVVNNNTINTTNNKESFDPVFEEPPMSASSGAFKLNYEASKFPTYHAEYTASKGAWMVDPTGTLVNIPFGGSATAFTYNDNLHQHLYSQKKYVPDYTEATMLAAAATKRRTAQTGGGDGSGGSGGSHDENREENYDEDPSSHATVGGFSFADRKYVA